MAWLGLVQTLHRITEMLLQTFTNHRQVTVYIVATQFRVLGDPESLPRTVFHVLGDPKSLPCTFNHSTEQLLNPSPYGCASG